MLTITENALVYAFHGETVRVDASLPGSVRVRAWMEAEMPDGPHALLDLSPAPCRTWQTEQAAFLQTGDLTVRLTAEGVLGFYRHDTLLLEEAACVCLPPDPTYPSRTQRLPLRRPARQWQAHGSDWQLTVRFTAPEEERLFGMGQYQQPTWNLKGAALELMQRNSQCTVPFVLSSAGYGFLWNQPAVGQAVFATNETRWEAIATRRMDYWLSLGETPAAILRQYADATGHAPDMPEFALGFWQSKLRYRTQAEVLAVAEAYRSRGLPLSVLIIDFFHWTKLGEWRFDPVAFPDPAAMIRQLHAMGVRLGVSVWPHVAWDSADHHALYAKGLLLRTDAGCDLTDTYGGNSTYLDLTNPEAQAFLQKRIRENYESCGVDFYWLDEAEPELPFYDQPLYRYHAGPAAQVGCLYPRAYAQAFAALDAQQDKPAMNLIRCAWAGSQRYGALVWSGDIPSTFAALRNQITAGLHMGLAGIPWWTMDIGGFRGGNIQSAAFRELLLRWFAFGTFCPVMRLHGHREPISPEEAARDYLQTGADNEVWSFGPDALRVCRRFLRIREHLRPCLRRAFSRAHTDGLPVMQPLFLSFPSDAESWATGDEYLLGGELLIAPVYTPGAQTRSVYLPAGCKWLCVWTGQALPGGQRVTMPTPLDQIPVFLRGDRADALTRELHINQWQEDTP